MKKGSNMNEKYLSIVIDQLETVIEEVKLLQNNMSNEINISDSFQICDYILHNFFNEAELSSDTVSDEFDTVVREQLEHEMKLIENNA